MDEKWKNESSGENFYHKEILCILRRSPVLKYWTGYVIIQDRKHPWWGAHPADLAYVPVHGKITYADFNPDDETDNSAWWIGFHCGHPFDLIVFDYELEGQKYPRLFKNHVYRDVEFAREQVMILADFARKALE